MQKLSVYFALTLCLAFSACQSTTVPASNAGNTEMSEKLDATQFENLLNKTPDAQLVDVRTPEEYEGGHLKGAKNIDYNSNEFNLNILTLDKTKSIFVYCLSGGRSGKAADFLRANGYKEVYELNGGILKWKAAHKALEGAANAETSELSLDDYHQKIKSDKLVLVDFNATWCGPCKMLSPILEDLAKDYKNKIELLKIDVDQNKTIANDLKIESLPTMILYKKGEKTWMKIGFTERATIEEAIKKYL